MTSYTGAAGRLTRRQGEVLVLARQGLKRREIAARLGVGEETVKTHLAAITIRIGARNLLRTARQGGHR
jgi:DNA-binding NarL/FixJ family response regulator